MTKCSKPHFSRLFRNASRCVEVGTSRNVPNEEVRFKDQDIVYISYSEKVKGFDYLVHNSLPSSHLPHADTARNGKSSITTLANHVEPLFRLLAQVRHAYPTIGREGVAC